MLDLENAESFDNPLEIKKDMIDRLYAKIYNNKDKDAFDDKDWTLLENKAAGGRFSTSNTDLIEYIITHGVINDTEEAPNGENYL